MTIEELYTKCSEALSEYLKDNATKGDLPADYVPLYKYLHSKNITIEDWNTLVKYVESTLASDATFDKNIRTLYELLSTTLQTAASKEDVENVINDVKASIKNLNARKLDKIDTTTNFNRVYGIASAGTQRTFIVSKYPNDGAVAQFNPKGNLQSNNPINDLDVVNKRTATSMVNEGVDSIVSQVVPSSDVAQYIQYTLEKDAKEYNGAYARAIITFDGIWIVANNSLYKVNLKNINNGDSPYNFTLETISTEILNTTTDPDTVERTNIQISEGVGVDAYICYRVKRTDGSYEIRIRAMDCSKGKVFDYATVATNTDFGLYEPFRCDDYIFYSKEIDAATQDIVFKKFKYNTDTHTFTIYAKEYVLCSGTNQKDDLGNVIPKSRPGFSVVVNVRGDNKEYRYLMLFETNVNNSKAGYPYVIQYMYFKFSGEDSATIDEIIHTEPKTLLKSKGEIVNIPYIDVIRDITDNENCKYVITYHTTEGYYGDRGDGDGIHKKIFRAMISKNHIMSGTTLRASDFVDLHTRDVRSSEWSGGWGSVCATNFFNTKGFCLLYASGYNNGSTSIQKNFNITLVQDLKQYIAHYLELNSSTAADGDTLAKRTSRGFLYATTATDLNTNNQPDLVVTKGFVGKYVANKMSNVYNYKGSVQTYAKLPTKANTGDVYNVIEAYQSYPAGTNFAWTGTQWDALGGSVDLSNYPTKEEVAADLSSKLDKVSTTGTSNRMYIIAPNGSQYIIKATNSVVGGEQTVPIRDTNGNFKVGTPKVDGDAANMKFVKDSVSTKADKKDNHDFLYGGTVMISNLGGNNYEEAESSEVIHLTYSNDDLTKITLIYTYPSIKRKFKGSSRYVSGANTKYNNRLFKTQIDINLRSDTDGHKYFTVGDVLTAIFGQHTSKNTYLVYRNHDKSYTDAVRWRYVEEGSTSSPANLDYDLTDSTTINLVEYFSKAVGSGNTNVGFSVSVYKYIQSENTYPFKTLSSNFAKAVCNHINTTSNANVPTQLQIKFIKNYQSKPNNKGWTGTMANQYLSLSMYITSSVTQGVTTYTYVVCPKMMSFISTPNILK